jgi:hypothetical protein
VNGENSRAGEGFGGAGGAWWAGRTATSASTSAVAAATADVPIKSFRRDHLMATRF